MKNYVLRRSSTLSTLALCSVRGSVREIHHEGVLVPDDVGGVGGDVLQVVESLPPTSGPSTQPQDFGIFLFSYEASDCYLHERKLAWLCEKRCVKRAPNGRGSVFWGLF